MAAYTIQMVHTVRVMLSSGGVLLTDLKDPTHTVTAAVKIMLKLAGTVITAGATATRTSNKCDQGHGSFSAAGADSESVMSATVQQYTCLNSGSPT